MPTEECSICYAPGAATYHHMQTGEPVLDGTVLCEPCFTLLRAFDTIAHTDSARMTKLLVSNSHGCVNDAMLKLGKLLMQFERMKMWKGATLKHGDKITELQAPPLITLLPKENKGE